MDRRFQLDVSRYQLLDDGRRVRLEKQPMELLILLATRRGELATREEIAAKLWPKGVHVDADQSINRIVRKLRIALHDDPDAPQFIETVVGKGYRFVGRIDVAVGRVEDHPPEPPSAGVRPPTTGAGWRRPALVFTVALLGIGAAAWEGFRIVRARSGLARAAPTIRSIAVLSFQNLSGDPAQDYFAEGVSDELTTVLAGISSLRVVSRTSAVQYGAPPQKPLAQIARELNVDALVEGSVTRSGDKVRITAQLIDARSDAHLWAQSYERGLGEILAVQDSVAADVAARVNASLSPSERRSLAATRTITPQAYEAYLRGRSELGKQQMKTMQDSVHFFERAIELEPQYAAAYAGLADAYTLMTNYSVMSATDALPKAKAAAQRALDLDSSSADAHAAMGFAKHHFDWDWAGAEAEYVRAIHLAPSDATTHLRYAELLSNTERHDEALREVARAQELDPLSVTIAGNVGRFLFYARRYDDAIRELKKAIVLHPDRTYLHIHLGLSYEQKRLYPEALAEFRRVGELTGNKSPTGLAHLYALTGQISAARRLLHDLEAPPTGEEPDWFFIASVYVALGDKDSAISSLRKALEDRDFFMTYLKVYPNLDPLRSDPRFRELIKRIGLAP